MRRLLSITLLLLFSLPLIAPLVALGQSPEAQLAACCRRAGAHHCSMSAEQLAILDGGRYINAPRMKCPMFPKAVTPAHRETAALAVSASFYAGIVSHPAQFHQVEAWARVALEGARQKRGPPTSVRLS